MTTTAEEVFSRWSVTDVTFSLISRRRTSTDTALSLRSSVSVSNHTSMKAEGKSPSAFKSFSQTKAAVLLALNCTP
jgi:hypothetical protein